MADKHLGKQEEEHYEPLYPALHMCVLIDARLSSRRDLVKDLNAIYLFESIVEAMYVDEGIQWLRNNPVDACFLGPTISREKMLEFIGTALKTPGAEECALLAILPHDTSDLHVLERSGLHGIITKPYTKMGFCDKVARAVIAANADGDWAQAALAILKEREKEKKKLPDPATKLATGVLSRVSSHLDKLVAGFKDNILGLDGYGEPTQETNEALDLIFQDITKPFSKNETLAEFSPFFRKCLGEWFIEMAVTNKKIATNNLARKVMFFRSRED